MFDLFISHRYRRLWTATFMCVSFIMGQPVYSGLQRIWTGAAGNQDWHDSGNWQPDTHAPQAGDHVFVTNDVILLTDQTPLLGSFTIANATLTFTNWNTALRAADILIDSVGQFTTAAPFGNIDIEHRSRVWIVCSNLTVVSGGCINVDGKGFRGGAVTSHGFGPGRGFGNANTGSGGGHGGVGGHAGPGRPAGGAVNGDSVEPQNPGSGGGGGATSRNGSGGDGGGVVRIDATGTVDIGGIITANGRPGGLWGGTEVWGGCGAGGSILITCHTFTGNPGGRLSARGGSGTDIGASVLRAGGGGGGRIAIHIAGAVADCPVHVNVAAGLGRSADLTDIDEAAQMGSIYLSDAGLMPLWDGQVYGWIHAPDFLHANLSSLAISHAIVGLPEEFELTVDGPVTLAENGGFFSGVSNRVRIAGDVNMSSVSFLRLETGVDWDQTGNLHAAGAGIVRLIHPHVHLSGNLSLSGNARMYCHGGATNGLTVEYGGLIHISGDAAIHDDAGVFFYSDPTDGGSVKWVMHDFTLGPDGFLNADGRGFAGGSGSDHSGYGPGRGIRSGMSNYGGGGGGHGGRGGDGNAVTQNPDRGNGGIVNGLEYAPINPGGGGGGGGNASLWGGDGGGVIWLDAGGTVTLHGMVTANGLPGRGNSWGMWGGAGAGGSIYIACMDFGGNGSLSADAGVYEEDSYRGGGGGGGRIAVWLQAAPIEIRHRFAAGHPHPGYMITVTDAHPDITDVSAKASAGWSGEEPHNAHDGTIRFLRFHIPGTVTVIR